MSDDADSLESFLRFFEREIAGRPLSAEERLKLKLYWPEMERERAAIQELTMSAAEKRLRLVAFKKKLKARQGTIAPDFEGLYKKRADLDRWLFESNDPRP